MKKSTNIDGRDQSSCQKWESIGNSNIGRQNMQSLYRDGIWQRKMCSTNNKSGKQQMKKEIDLPKEEKNRTLGEMLSKKHLEELEVDTIKYAEIKEKRKK